MVKIDGKYKLKGNEDFVEYLIGLGSEISQEAAEKIAEAGSVLTVKAEGNKVTLVDEFGPSTTTKIFTLGESFEEELLKAIKVQTVATLDGNNLSLKAVSKDGRTGERLYEFSDNGLIVSYSSSHVSKIGKRIYERV